MTAAADQPCIYHIQVEGTLSPHWLGLFAHLHPQVSGGSITLCGEFADQAALHGVLQSLYNLGCVLVSVRLLSPARGLPARRAGWPPPG